MTTVERAVLFDMPRPDGRAGAEFDAVLQDVARLRSLWAAHGATVLAEWIARHPAASVVGAGRARAVPSPHAEDWVRQ